MQTIPEAAQLGSGKRKRANSAGERRIHLGSHSALRQDVSSPNPERIHQYLRLSIPPDVSAPDLEPDTSLFTPDSDSDSDDYAASLAFLDIASSFDQPPAHTPPPNTSPAFRTAPPIPGLVVFGSPTPHLLVPHALAQRVFDECMARYFTGTGADQVMLFTRAGGANSSLPAVLVELLETVEDILKGEIPVEDHATLFGSFLPTSTASSGRDSEAKGIVTSSTPSRSRQAIINLYAPGQGIAPHVDLLARFGDGIVGVSLGPDSSTSSGSCVMRFEKAPSPTQDSTTNKRDEPNVGKEIRTTSSYDVFLPPRSILVLTKDARFNWTHGIEGRMGDWVVPDAHASDASGRGDDGLGTVSGKQEEGAAVYVPRTIRMSITFRWLLPGAEIVGSTSA